jgi:hypothetical protein
MRGGHTTRRQIVPKKVSGPQQMSVYAIEVARRQQDGTWRWLIGDSFTVSPDFRGSRPPALKKNL